MSRFGDADHLAYIQTSISQIEASGVADAGPAALAANPDLCAATLRRLETMGESARQLSEGLKEAHPEIPWRDVADFRNRLAHGHLDVDLGVVCDVARRDLAPLRHMARQELTLGDDLGLGL